GLVEALRERETDLLGTVAQTLHVVIAPERAPAVVANDLVEAVREDEASIVETDLRGTLVDELPGDVDDLAHASNLTGAHLRRKASSRAIRLASPSAPGHGPPFDDAHEGEQDDPDERETYQGGIELWGVEDGAGLLDQVAQPLVGAHELADHGADDCE